MSKFMYYATRNTVALFLRIFNRLAVYGGENIPLHGPLLIVSNHCSNLDPFIIAAGSPRQLVYLAKEELFRYRIAAAFFRSVGARPLPRASATGGAATLRSAEKVLADGEAIGIFPEGTRSLDGEMKPFLPGAALLSARMNTSIVPAAITGSFACMRKGASFPRPAKIRVIYGKPVGAPSIENMSSSERKNAIRDFASVIENDVRALLEELRNKV